MQIRMCPTCEKQDNFQERMDSNSSGQYMQKFFKGLINSGKYDMFCRGKPDKDANKPQNKNIEVLKDHRITDYYIRDTEKKERIFVFPHIKKEMIFGDKNGDEDDSDTKVDANPQDIEEKQENIDDENQGQKPFPDMKPKEEGGTIYEFIVGNEKVPDCRLEIKVKQRQPGGDDPSMLPKNEMKEEDEPIKHDDDDDNDSRLKNEVKEEDLFNNITIEIPFDKEPVANPVENNSRDYSQALMRRNLREKTVDKTHNLDNLGQLANDWYCCSSIQIVKELQHIYMANSKNVPVPEKINMTKKWYELLQDLDEKNTNALRVFDNKMKTEIQEKFNMYSKYRVHCEQWPPTPQPFRKYQEIWEYVPAVETETYKEEISKVLETRKDIKCQPDCPCTDLKALGPYNLDKQTWKSACPRRANLLECQPDSGCDYENCKNKPIATKQRKSNRPTIGEVEEKFCWGIDYATHNHILLVLPEFPNVDKNDFIENKLLRAVHLTDKAYDMLEVCR
mmetsp:Transcript_13251/g.11335  ORF Transcript_13251/g.11335 Transcript_13251/m.11335 type:complete len:506 (-) Transcript_13251:2319-3836(-)